MKDCFFGTEYSYCLNDPLVGSFLDSRQTVLFLSLLSRVISDTKIAVLCCGEECIYTPLLIFFPLSIW